MTTYSYWGEKPDKKNQELMDEKVNPNQYPVVPGANKDVFNEDTYLNDHPYQPQDAVPPPVVQPQVSVADQLMKDLFSTRETAPVPDAAKAERLRRMGRLNQVSRGVGVLGDMLSLGLGANVKRRQPDNVAPAIYQAYENMMDRDKSLMDAYKLRDFQTQRSNTLYGLSAEDRKRHDKLVEEDTKASRALAKEMRDETTRRYKEGIEYRNTKDKQDREDKVYSRTHLTPYQSIMAGKEVAGKAGKPVTIKTAQQTYTFAPEEASFLRSKAIQNYDLLKKKYASWFINVPERDEWGDAIPGKFTVKLDSRVKDEDLIRAQKELDEEDAKTSPSNSKVMLTNPGMTNQAKPVVAQPNVSVGKEHPDETGMKLAESFAEKAKKSLALLPSKAMKGLDVYGSMEGGDPSVYITVPSLRKRSFWVWLNGTNAENEAKLKTMIENINFAVNTNTTISEDWEEGQQIQKTTPQPKAAKKVPSFFQ